jgi:hypothetical protein
MPIFLTDIVNYRYFAEKIGSGELPYLGFLYEYPPLSLLPVVATFKVAQLFSPTSFKIYRLIFMLIMLLFDFLLYKKVKEKTELVFSYIILSSLFLPFSLERLDLIMVFCMVSGIQCMDKGEYKRAVTWLSVGGWYKLFPFFGAVGFLREKKYFIKNFLWIVSLNVLILYGFYLFFGENLFDFLRFHLMRPLQIESITGSSALILSKLFKFKAPIIESFGSDNVIFLQHRSVLLVLSFLQIIYLSTFCYRFYKKPEAAKVIDLFCALIFGFLATSKVFSVQYLLWPLSMMFLSSTYEKLAFVGRFVFGLMCLISTILFINYLKMVLPESFWWHGLLFIRNILFLWVALKINMNLWRQLA